MKAFRLFLLLALGACAPTAWGAGSTRDPHIGYVFPGGGRQGAVVQVLVGGQYLRDVKEVYVSGEGVSASFVEHYTTSVNFNTEQRKELQQQLVELRETRLVELEEQGIAVAYPGRRRGASPAASEEEEDAEPVELPKHPLLRDLDGMSLRQLQHVANEFLDYQLRSKRQPNAQLGEMVLIEVTIAPDAAPGDRELRLGMPVGLTNPICFQIGTLPETREEEPNDPGQFTYLPDDSPADLPVLVNGQVMPGDVDRFPFRAEAGQRLVIQASARRLVPFLADAVPGWFQATLALYDQSAREIAFADDYRFHPDPVMFFEVPEDGVYVLEIRDAIYRGREDFVYRVAIGELPFITEAFPLGGPEGGETVAAIDGWNLPAKTLVLDTQPGGDSIRQATLAAKGMVSNEVTYAVDALPECTEAEPNDDARNAQRVDLPLIVNGRIDRPGDVDVLRFEGHEGDQVVAEVVARRLHSPLDSVLRLIDASGRVLEWNDDRMCREAGYLHPDMGLLTHHADSYVIARLPQDGTYYVRLDDAQVHGGEAYGYRLRVAPSQPDFALRVAPATLSMPAGAPSLVQVHALRKDGFEGDIDLALRDAPAGFTLSGGRIPAGRDCVRMTLAAPERPFDHPLSLRLEGRAFVGGQEIRRPATPSEDLMQAFLYRHLAPTEELIVTVGKRVWNRVPGELAQAAPVKVPLGGAVQVRVNVQRISSTNRIELVPSEPPDGITVRDASVVPGALVFQLRAEGDALEPGFADNLIVEVVVHVPAQNTDGQVRPARRNSYGILPAIPFVVVQPQDS